jgi:hypothetical protein
MMQQLEIQKERYQNLSSNTTVSTINVPVKSVAVQFEASATLMEDTASLGVRFYEFSYYALLTNTFLY